MEKLSIGLFGFGCVGEGVYDIITQTKPSDVVIKKICVKNINKPRKADQDLFTDHKEDIFNDPEINAIVEVIDDAEEAFHIVSQALRNNLKVVTANKKMVATYFSELQQLVKEYDGELLYDAAVCGAIPVISNLEHYFDFDQIESIQGVFNGTTNYILTKQFEAGLSFEEVLTEAQQKGFAETDPSADIDGFDAKYKLKLVIAHAYGLDVPVEDILTFGIRKIKEEDVRLARNKELKVKLLSKVVNQGNKVSALVAPVLVDSNHSSYDVNLEDNYAEINGKFTRQQVLKGKGAGSFPTGSAVYSDIRSLIEGKLYTERADKGLEFTKNAWINVKISSSNQALISLVDFDEEHQNYSTENYFSKSGRLNLRELKKLRNEDVFVTLIGDEVSVIEEIQETVGIH